MPNVLDSTGLTLQTRQELIDSYTASMKAAYGPDINLDSDTPDGQQMNIWVQGVLDMQELLLSIYNSMDPDTAIGRVLDARASLNGIQRQAGTYTQSNIDITVSKALTLYGAEQTLFDPFTVADNAGNQWVLMNTYNFAAAGTQTLLFRAKTPGKVLTTPNTITVPVSIIIGVTAINNPTTYSILGIDEETDAEFRLRRQKSIALGSQGYLAGLLAALENLTGMTYAKVYENTTSSTDGDGIPSHSIWVIVAGSASAADIAGVIYKKRNAGAGMKGSQVYNINQADGSIFTIYWDVVASETLFIKATLSSLDGINNPDYASIISGIVQSFAPGVNEQVNVNSLATQIQAIDKNALVTSPGFSSTAGGSYTSTKTPASKANQFTFGAANIILLPILVSPGSASVAHSTTSAKTFTALGGYGTITWSLHTNVSGGSINSSTGVYSSGATPGTDVVRATDSLGNTTDVNVTVT